MLARQAMMHLVHAKNEELRRADTPALLDEEVLEEVPRIGQRKGLKVDGDRRPALVVDELAWHNTEKSRPLS